MCKFEVRGTPIIKFQSEDKIENLQKGFIYAKTLGYYRNLERETGNDKVGDEFEAMIHSNNGFLRIEETGEVVELSDALIKTADSDDFVFCMFGIDPSLQKFTFTDQQKDEMLSFGDTSLIILNSNEFIRRVCLAANKHGCTVHHGWVQYYDSSLDNGDFLVSLYRDMRNVAMWKREKYSYQQEYRFVFTPGNRDDHICLNIEDISDISTIIPSDKALSGEIIRRN